MYADENENELLAEEPEQEAYGEGEPQEEEEWWEEKVEAPPEPEPENTAPGVDANGRRMLPLDYLKKYPLHRAVESGNVEDMTLILTMQPSLLNGVTLPLQRTAVVEAARLSNFQVTTICPIQTAALRPPALSLSVSCVVAGVVVSGQGGCGPA
jgi:hypothetical protein